MLSEQSYDTLKEWLSMHEEARYVASLTSDEPELIKFKQDYEDSILFNFKGFAKSRK